MEESDHAAVADAGFVEGGFYDNIAHKAHTKISEAMPTFD